MVGQQNCLQEPWEEALQVKLLARALIARKTHGEGFPLEAVLKKKAYGL
jgi:hypothetical protein